MKRLFLVLLLTIPLAGCGTIQRILVPAAPVVAPATSGTAEDARVVEMKKAVIATHLAFYVPLMETLGALRDAEVPAIVSAWPQIQAATVKYVALKKQATTLIDTLGGSSDHQVNAIMLQINNLIAGLQKNRDTAGGAQ